MPRRCDSVNRAINSKSCDSKSHMSIIIADYASITIIFNQKNIYVLKDINFINSYTEKVTC